MEAGLIIPVKTETGGFLGLMARVSLVWWAGSRLLRDPVSKMKVDDT